MKVTLGFSLDIRTALLGFCGSYVFNSELLLYDLKVK